MQVSYKYTMKSDHTLSLFSIFQLLLNPQMWPCHQFHIFPWNNPLSSFITLCIMYISVGTFIGVWETFSGYTPKENLVSFLPQMLNISSSQLVLELLELLHHPSWNFSCLLLCRSWGVTVVASSWWAQQSYPIQRPCFKAYPLEFYWELSQRCSDTCMIVLFH